MSADSPKTFRCPFKVGDRPALPQCAAGTRSVFTTGGELISSNVVPTESLLLRASGDAKSRRTQFTICTASTPDAEKICYTEISSLNQ